MTTRNTTSAEGSATTELYTALARGYAGYHLALASWAYLRSSASGDPGSGGSERPHRTLFSAALALNALTLPYLCRRRGFDDPLVAWRDALAASGATAIALGLGGPTEAGPWLHLTRWSPSAQWTSAGVSLLGRPGASRVLRFGAIVAPFTVWARGRRRLRSEGAPAAAFMAFAANALAGRAIISGLHSAAREIDRRNSRLVAERERNSIREQDAEIRRSVVGVSLDALQSIEVALGGDRAEVARLARIEERRLRSWIDSSYSHPPAAPDDGVTPDELTEETSATIENFLLVAETLLRVASAAQVAFESGQRPRPRGSVPFAVLAVVHAAVTIERLNRGGTRRALVTSDVCAITLATAFELVVARRGGVPGWSDGYAQAMEACAGLTDDAALAGTAVGAVTAIRALGNLLAPGPPRERVGRAAANATMAGTTVWISHRFNTLAHRLATELSASAAALAQTRAEAAIEDVRRRHHHLLHDSVLQVLVWLQKPDLSDVQLSRWLGSVTARLLAEARGEEIAPPSLSVGLGELISAFEFLGVSSQVSSTDQLDDVPADVAICALDIVNEALTNVLKHSTDRSPSVEIARSGDHQLMLRITNVLTDPDARPRRPGTGTKAMIERALSVQGDVVCGSESGRFVVAARLPLRVSA